MVVRPYFSLEANGSDVTEHIKNNLISLSFNDADGFVSDELSITLAGLYIRPELGDNLRLCLGVEGGFYNYGSFKVHSCSKDHLSQITQLRATSMDFSGSLKERNKKQWEAVTLRDIAAEIASKHGMSCIAPDAQQVKIEHKAQNNISDIEFVAGLAAEYGFMGTVKDNTIILQAKGDPDKYSHKFEIDISDCTSLSVSRAAKDAYSSVVLEWQDRDSAEMQKVTAGSGSPVLYIRDLIPNNPEEAQKIAEGRLAESNESSVMGSLSIVGGRFMRAGGKLILKGAGEDDGEYHINSVNHSMSPSGYTVSLDFSEIKGV